ncbi:MAG TPA: hypothetical protein VEM95_03805 [Thermoplasmata archaeon]|nr:hypothetical protein [Thermoplasmata archaeon]
MVAEIQRRLAGRNASRAAVRACVDELKRLFLVTEDPKRGAMWTFFEEPPDWRKKRWVKI